MTAARLVSPLAYDEGDLDPPPSLPPSTRRPIGDRRSWAAHLDPIEEALLSRPPWDSRRLEPAVHEVLYRFDTGDVNGALAAADVLFDGCRVPALTVSLDVLDEIELDHCAVLVLAYTDGLTDVSQVVRQSGLPREDVLRTLCELIERRILVLRSPEQRTTGLRATGG
jgi:hypothetical protein